MYGAPAPKELLVWDIVFRTGWTLDAVRSITIQDYHDYIQILDGRKKAGIK